MTSYSIHTHPLGEHHRHAAVKTVARHLKPKHPEPRHVTRVERKRSLGGVLLAAAATVAVVATVAMWAPTLGASPTVALGSDTALNQAGAAAAQVPLLVPGTVGDGPTAGSPALSATEVQVAAARTFAGSQLASNAGLTLSATARELLVGGQVDARSILSLGQYLGQTQLTVTDFPASETETGTSGIRRQILISGLAGVPLGAETASPDGAASASGAASVAAWFQALSAPVTVQSVVRTPAGVLVTFALGEPLSMLPSPAPTL